MTYHERRSTNGRRQPRPLTIAVPLGAVLDRAERTMRERRTTVRRRTDVRSIAAAVRYLNDPTPARAIVDREWESASVALFRCGCIACEPVASGAPPQFIECVAHEPESIRRGRRRTDLR